MDAAPLTSALVSLPHPAPVKTIFSCPDEIVVDIFKNLRVSDILSLALVNRHFCRIASDERLWNYLCRRDFMIQLPKRKRHSWKDHYRYTLMGHNIKILKATDSHIFLAGPTKIWHLEKNGLPFDPPFKVATSVATSSSILLCSELLMDMRGNLIFSGGTNKRVKVMIQEGRKFFLLKNLHGHESTISTLKAKHGFLLSGDTSGWVILWDLRKMQLLFRKKFPGKIQALAFFQDQVVVGLSNRALYLLDMDFSLSIAKDLPLRIHNIFTWPVGRAFSTHSKSGRTLFLQQIEKQLVIVDEVASDCPLSTFFPGRKFPNFFATTKDGRLLYFRKETAVGWRILEVKGVAVGSSPSSLALAPLPIPLYRFERDLYLMDGGRILRFVLTGNPVEAHFMDDLELEGKPMV